jgi:hypothetical protein
MNKNSISTLMLSLIFSVIVFVSCSEDDPALPTISLSETLIDALAEENISISASYVAEAGAESITITKYWDGTSQGTPEVKSSLQGSGTINFNYTVTQEDAEHVLKFNFTIIDNEGQIAQKELVVNVELTAKQLLLKYDWLLSEEIRVLTGENDIADHYNDDVYRFNADGTYQKSIGTKIDAFSDIWYKHCTYDFNEDTMVLKLHRTGAFGGDAYDTINITLIDHNGIEADVTYLGLDAFNTGSEAVPYEASEEYIKKFVAQAKGSSFDPYAPGADDDVEGPSATPCNTSDFVNN